MDDLLDNNSLKKNITTKALCVALMSGLLFPPVILRFFDHEYNLDFFYKTAIGFFFIFPIIFIIVYLVLLIKYKCPSCNSFWCYQKVGAEVVNSYTIERNGVNRAIQEIVIEYKCSKCNFVKFVKKLHKLRVKK